jgi:hypothetical protein
MKNSTLRKIVLDELYAIATTPKHRIIPEGFDKDPSKLPDGTTAPEYKTDTAKAGSAKDKKADAGTKGTIIKALQAKSGDTPEDKQAQEKLLQAAMRCGYGKDVEAYRKSGWKCKQGDPFDTTAEREDWRTWLQQTHPDDYNKLALPTIEASPVKPELEIKMYYKHIAEYAKTQKAQGKTTPGVDDEGGGGLTDWGPLQWIVVAIAANKVLAGISGSFIVTALFGLIRRGRTRAKARKKKRNAQVGSQYKVFTNFLRLSTHDIINQIAKEPAAMKAEIQKVAKKSNAELRAGVEQLTGKKLSDRQIEEIKTAMQDPTLIREAVVSARTAAIEDFMKNKGNFTADQVINLMTKTERAKYEKYIRQLERRRKPKP